MIKIDRTQCFNIIGLSVHGLDTIRNLSIEQSQSRTRSKYCIRSDWLNDLIKERNSYGKMAVDVRYLAFLNHPMFISCIKINVNALWNSTS